MADKILDRATLGGAGGQSRSTFGVPLKILWYDASNEVCERSVPSKLSSQQGNGNIKNLHFFFTTGRSRKFLKCFTYLLTYLLTYFTHETLTQPGFRIQIWLGYPNLRLTYITRYFSGEALHSGCEFAFFSLV